MALRLSRTAQCSTIFAPSMPKDVYMLEVQDGLTGRGCRSELACLRATHLHSRNNSIALGNQVENRDLEVGHRGPKPLECGTDVGWTEWLALHGPRREVEGGGRVVSPVKPVQSLEASVVAGIEHIKVAVNGMLVALCIPHGAMIRRRGWMAADKDDVVVLQARYHYQDAG